MASPARPDRRLSLHWLGGWGVSPLAVRERLATALPGADIVVEAPTPEALTRALATPAGVVLGGWSLGAHLLLRAALDGRMGAERRIVLVCPFPAFPAEAGQGGRVVATQLKFLRRRMRTDALAALEDFHRRAGLDLPPPTELPYPAEELAAGLDILADPSPVSLPGAGSDRLLPPSALLLGGARDPLVDNDLLARLLPGLTVLPDAGHDLASFVREIARLS